MSLRKQMQSLLRSYERPGAQNLIFEIKNNDVPSKSSVNISTKIEITHMLIKTEISHDMCQKMHHQM